VNTDRCSQLMLAAAPCVLIALVWQTLPHPAVAVVIGLVPLLALLVLRLPFVMVLSFVAFSFFRLHEVVPALYSLKIPLLLSLASIVALAWHVGFTRRIQTWWRTELTVISVFFVLVLVGVFAASNRPVAIEYFKGIYWKIALMTFAIAWLTHTPKDFALASKLITASGVLVGCVALFNKANGIGLVEETRVTIGRALGSVLGDPNDLALVLMFPCAFAVSLMLTRDLTRGTRLLGMIAVPILFMAVLATQSRGGLLGIMAVFGVFGYRRVRSKALFMTIASIGAGVLYAAAGIAERASGGAAEAGLDASAAGRLYAWEAAFGMALHNPLTGVGLDNFYSNYFFYSPHWDGLNHAVHSTWFGVLAETGFLGLAVFITLITMLIRTAARCARTLDEYGSTAPAPVRASAQAVLAGLIGTVISGTFLTQGFTWPIYILAALVVALAHWVDVHLTCAKENDAQAITKASCEQPNKYSQSANRFANAAECDQQKPS
jgi:O-antigen ligase